MNWSMIETRLNMINYLTILSRDNNFDKCRKIGTFFFSLPRQTMRCISRDADWYICSRTCICVSAALRRRRQSSLLFLPCFFFGYSVLFTDSAPACNACISSNIHVDSTCICIIHVHVEVSPVPPVPRESCVVATSSSLVSSTYLASWDPAERSPMVLNSPTLVSRILFPFFRWILWNIVPSNRIRE